jgi:hypothetical protein
MYRNLHHPIHQGLLFVSVSHQLHGNVLTPTPFAGCSRLPIGNVFSSPRAASVRLKDHLVACTVLCSSVLPQPLLEKIVPANVLHISTW